MLLSPFPTQSTQATSPGYREVYLEQAAVSPICTVYTQELILQESGMHAHLVRAPSSRDPQPLGTASCAAAQPLACLASGCPLTAHLVHCHRLRSRCCRADEEGPAHSFQAA